MNMAHLRHIATRYAMLAPKHVKVAATLLRNFLVGPIAVVGVAD
jgi:hypothetical protein